MILRHNENIYSIVGQDSGQHISLL